MSIAWGVLAQSPKPEAHDKVLDNNSDTYYFNTYWRHARSPEIPWCLNVEARSAIPAALCLFFSRHKK